MTVPAIALFGGDNLVGNNLAAALAGAGFGALAGVRSNDYIWDPDGASWVQYEAGANSNPRTTLPTGYGPEIDVFSQLRTQFPLQSSNNNVAVLKMGRTNSSVTSTGPAASSTDGGAWAQTAVDTLAAEALAMVAAAKASQISGESVDFKAIVWVQDANDAFLPALAHSHRPLLRQFLDTLRISITTGNTTQIVPIILVEPHSRYPVMLGADTTRAQLRDLRESVRSLVRESDWYQAVATDHLTLNTGTQFYDAQSTVALGAAIGTALQSGHGPKVNAAAPSNEAVVYLVAGQSNAEGYADLSDASATALGAIPGVKIWHFQPETQTSGPAWETLQAGVNEQAQRGSANTKIGFTPTLARSLQSRHPGQTVHIIKFAAGGSNLTPFENLYGPAAAGLRPRVFRWDPGNADIGFGLFSGMFSEIEAAVDALLNSEGFDSVRMHGMFWMQGEGDAIDAFAADQYRDQLKNFLSMVRYRCSQLRSGPIVQADNPMPITIGIIHQDTDATLFPNVSAVRAAQRQVSFELDRVTTIDTSAAPLGVDEVHYTAAGYEQVGYLFASGLLAAAEDTTPLFNENVAELLRSLRLSNLADRTATDEYEIVLDAIRYAHTEIYRKLGVNRIDFLLDIPLVPKPETDTEFLRLSASQVEILLCKSVLLRSLKTQFADGSSAIYETWNREGLGRNLSASGIDEELKRIYADITRTFEMLKGQIVPGSDRRYRAVTVTSNNENPPTPRSSIRVSSL